MNEFDVSQFKDMYISEAKEYLSSLNNSLLQLEKEPNNIEVLNEIFRIAHTLKGMSATMGFEKIANLSHEMENLLDKIRKKELTINEDIVNTLFKCVDILEAAIDTVAKTGEDKEIITEDVIKELQQMKIAYSIKEENKEDLKKK